MGETGGGQLVEQSDGGRRGRPVSTRTQAIADFDQGEHGTALGDLASELLQLRHATLLEVQREPLRPVEDADVRPGARAELLRRRDGRLGIGLASQDTQGGVMVHRRPRQGGLAEVGDERLVPGQAPLRLRHVGEFHGRFEAQAEGAALEDGVG